MPRENLLINQTNSVSTTASVICILQTVSRKLWSTRLILLCPANWRKLPYFAHR